jgi:predicted DCC family thiol-disulfide oxidoreductase YuxK
MVALTLYFDSACPFCRREMARLGGWDRLGRLAFVDIAEPGFDPAPLGVTLAAMNTELHGMRADGSMLVGTDAILEAYTLAGRGWLVSPLRVAALRLMLASAYRSFARNRYRISRWLGIDGCQIYFGGQNGT